MPYKDKEKRKAYEQTRPEENKAYNRAYYQANKERLNANSRVSHQAHRHERKVSNRASNQRRYAEAVRILGNKCACPGCEVSEPAFLTIDHINGRPKGQRRSALTEARASGWDKTKFQVLCWNCNCAKKDRGFCPVHQADPGQRNGHSPVANPQQSLWPL